MMQEKDNYIKCQMIQNAETYMQLIFVNMSQLKVIDTVPIALYNRVGGVAKSHHCATEGCRNQCMVHL